MSSIDERNVAFWDELCGTSQARQLGVTDSSPESLEKFDAWYFELYPYLFDHVPLEQLVDRDVLEIGLGYGSLSQKIAEGGARYVGLDIATGPVEMVRHRLRQAALPGGPSRAAFSLRRFLITASTGSSRLVAFTTAAIWAKRSKNAGDCCGRTEDWW